MFTWNKSKHAEKDSAIQTGFFERCLWIMTPPGNEVLPSCRPTPGILKLAELQRYRDDIERLCRTRKKCYLLAPMTQLEVMPPTEKNVRRQHATLWLYTLPTAFGTLPYDEYQAHPLIPSSSKRLYASMAEQWDNSVPLIAQLLQWYCLIRGQLLLLERARTKAIIAPYTQWSSRDMSTALSDPDAIGVRGSAPLCDLPARTPVLLARLVQDAWACLQQLSAKPNVLGRRTLALEHVQKEYKQVILSLLNRSTQNKQNNVQAARRLMNAEVDSQLTPITLASTKGHRKRPHAAKDLPPTSVDLLV